MVTVLYIDIVSKFSSFLTQYILCVYCDMNILWAINQKLRQVPDWSKMRELQQILQGIELISDFLSDPKLFKLCLIQKIQDKPILHRARQKIVQKWYMSFDTLSIDPTTRISQNTGLWSIILWGQSIPQNSKYAMIFMDHLFDYQSEMIRKMSHELSHSIGPRSAYQPFENLFDTMNRSRQETWKWLSLIWSIEFYSSRWWAEQATEDVTELINMYMLDPQYLRQRLQRCRMMSQDFAQTHKILSLSQDAADTIYNTIQNTVNRFLVS